MSLADKVQVMKDVAEAMHEAHKLGIVHRDLKPANIMVERSDDGRWFPVVMDFGLAHETDRDMGLTRSGALLGTPSYMPPEQARALGEDLGRYIEGEPILGERPSLVERMRRRARRHKALVTVSAASLALILVAGALGLRSWLEARRTERRAAERARLAERLGQD